MNFFIASLPAQGYEVTVVDFEGFEAEVYFAGKGASGMVMVLMGCRGENSVASIRLWPNAR